MKSNADQLSHYENSFGLQRAILSLFVKTNDSSRQLLVCCRRDETIKSVCKTIANIYFKTFMSGDRSDDSDIDDYYMNFENQSVIVDHLEFDGYVLPAFQKVGELLENKAFVTARIRLTGKQTPKTKKTKAVKKEEKMKVKKAPKEPKEKKEKKEPKGSKTKRTADILSDDSLDDYMTRTKKVLAKKGAERNLMEIESDSEMEEKKLEGRDGIRNDDSSIEEMVVKPKMQVESPVKKNAVAAAKKKPEPQKKQQKTESATKQHSKTANDESDSSESLELPIRLPHIPKKKPVLKPSKTMILAGMNEKMFGEKSDEVLPVAMTKMQVEPAVAKKPAAATTTTAQAQPDAKAQVEQSKAELSKKMSMNSTDSKESSKKKPNTVETKKVDVKSDTEEEVVKPSAKTKMQVEPPAPPAASKDSMMMKPPEGKGSKKKVPAQDLKIKNIDHFVDNLSGEDSEEVPSPRRPGKQKKDAVAKPKFDPIVIVPAVATPQEEAKIATKIDKKEVIELESPAKDSVMEITMTKSVYTTGPPKIGEVTAFRKSSTQELEKPIIQEESPVIFKIHELIDSEEEDKQKKSGKKSGKKTNESEKGGKQGPQQQQKKTQNIILENPVASANEPKKLDLNGKGKGKEKEKEEGKGKQAARTSKKKKRTLSSSSSSETELDEKPKRNVNLFQ